MVGFQVLNDTVFCPLQRVTTSRAARDNYMHAGFSNLVNAFLTYLLSDIRIGKPEMAPTAMSLALIPMYFSISNTGNHGEQFSGLHENAVQSTKMARIMVRELYVSFAEFNPSFLRKPMNER